MPSCECGDYLARFVTREARRNNLEKRNDIIQQLGRVDQRRGWTSAQQRLKSRNVKNPQASKPKQMVKAPTPEARAVDTPPFRNPW